MKTGGEIVTTGEPVEEPKPRRKVAARAPSAAAPDRRVIPAREALSFEDMFGRDDGTGELEDRKAAAPMSRQHQSEHYREIDEYYSFIADEVSHLERAMQFGNEREKTRPREAGLRQAEHDAATAVGLVKSWLGF